MFKDTIRELRIKNNMSQEEMGAILGLKKATISNWERGKSTPPFDVLTEIAEHFNVTTDYLSGSKILASKDLNALLKEHKIIDDDDNINYEELKLAIDSYKAYQKAIKKGVDNDND